MSLPDSLDRIRRGLGSRARAGQCFCIGIAGESVSVEERHLIREMAPGAFLLARRNLASYEQSVALIDELSALTVEACGVPPLFGADEEGGFVLQTDRFSTPAPSPLAVARAGRTETATWLARAMGQRLRALGIPLAFSPLLDVNDLPENPVIGIRSFGPDPEVVTRFARSYLAGFRAAGVMATAKHFPGHGSTALDSHRDLPVLDHDRRRLDAVELPPFRAAVADGVPVVMSAHVSFPRVDPAGELPATFVPYFMGRTLREEFGFQGITISDDLGMNAIREGFRPRDIARFARAADLDLLLFALDRDLAATTWEAMLDGISSGAIGTAGLEASLERLLGAKQEWLGWSDGTGWGRLDAWRAAGRAFEAADADVAGIASEVARSSVTALQELPGRSWRPQASERLGMIVVKGSAGGSAFEAGDVVPIVCRLHARTDVWEITDTADTGAIREILAACRQCDRLLLVLFSRGAPNRVLRDLVIELGRLDRPLAVLSVVAPLAVPPVPGLHLNVATYGYSQPALAAGVDRLWGRT